MIQRCESSASVTATGQTATQGHSRPAKTAEAIASGSPSTGAALTPAR